MSIAIWSNAFSLMNGQKIKQLSLLTIRELIVQLPIIAIATVLIGINIFFLKSVHLDIFIIAGVLYYSVLTTRSSAGLKNIGYYFRYSWLFAIAILLVVLFNFLSKYSLILGALFLLFLIFFLLRAADVCFKSAICGDDFLTPFTSIFIIFRGLPFLLIPFLGFTSILYAAQLYPIVKIGLPLVMCLFIIWCAHWYIIALYEQR